MTEVVNGIVIGTITQEIYVAFFDLDGKQICCGQWFDDEQEAEAWFREHWPTAYSKGAEMRVYE